MSASELKRCPFCEKNTAVRRIIAALLITPVIPYAFIVGKIGGYETDSVIDTIKQVWKNIKEED